MRSGFCCAGVIRKLHRRIYLVASNLLSEVSACNERIEWDAKSGGVPSALRRVQIAAVVSAEPYLAADSSTHYVA